MKYILYRSSLIIVLIVISFTTKINAQKVEGSNKKLLIRDSLDFKQTNAGFNTKSKEFNPIPYKDGLLFISNKQTEANQLGFNKVYWIPKTLLGINDSLVKSFSLNDDFTAPTSNDNDILYRFNKKKIRAANNIIENQFAEFIPEESFSIDDSAKYIVYPQRSKRKINGKYKWELWEANLFAGKLKNARKINIKDSAADYLFPYLDKNSNKLYFSSDRAGGKGGFDIYTIDKINGVWSTVPVAISNINTEHDEKSPTVYGFDLFFSSNRPGGLGGFDLYRTSLHLNLKEVSVFNLGYPLNSESDNVSVAYINNEFYTTSNKPGSMDIALVQYQPISIPIQGNLSYNSDSSLSSKQPLIVYDNDAQIIIDTIYTDINAAYSFNAKPNRNYTFKVKNADGFEESFEIKTSDQVVPSITYALNLKGRSPKQIKDSTEMVWAVLEQKRQDSIASFSLESKFIVYYGFDKSYLTAKEHLVLDSLYNKLQKMPSTYLIVGAFTDCIGSFKYNYTLSVKRAKYVVNYLKKKGLAPNRFVSNGYSKNYTITPCSVSLNKKAQQNNRRAEIVLSSVGNTNWAKLEQERGKSFYAVYNSKNNVTPTAIKIIASPIVKAKQIEKKIDTTILLKPAVVASTSKVKVTQSISKQNIKVYEIQINLTSTRKDTSIAKMNEVDKNDTIKEVKSTVALTKPVVKPIVKPIIKSTVDSTSKPNVVVAKPIIQVASPSTYVDDEISKAEILKALDSLATLKREQERIVEYLTKRINKKPIDVFVSSDSVSIEIYDNAIHDKDSVSIIYNNRIIVDKQELKVNNPIKFKLLVDKNKKYNELIMVAENLGIDPPNTAVMFVTEKNGRRQQVLLSTDMQHNEVVYFIRIGKE